MIVKALNDTVNTGLAGASIRETIERTGAAASTLSPSEFKSFIAAEHNKWKDAVQLAGIKAE
jgi:tripartite-type tricarboxylate transporter receptor subunit TctC